MSITEITFEKLPEAVAHIIKEIELIKKHVITPPPSPKSNERIRMNVDDVCILLGKAKPTIYTLCRKGIIPSYKDGKSLFFFRNEMTEYQNSCRKVTPKELEQQIDKESHQPMNRPTRRA